MLLNCQARHGYFTHREGLGLVYAVRSPFFLRAAGATVLRVGAPGSAEAASADFLSLGAALREAKPGDIVELLPGVHRTDTLEGDSNAAEAGAVVRSEVIIRGAPGGVRPTLVAGKRVLTIINSCLLQHMCLSPVHTGGQYFPTTLVSNVFSDITNVDIHVTVVDCVLHSPNPRVPAVLLRREDSAPAGRTALHMRGCTMSSAAAYMPHTTCTVDENCVFTRGAGVEFLDEE